MQETYYAALEPDTQRWNVSPITHEFPETHWVFRVNARSPAEAVQKGLESYRTLTIIPTESEMEVLRAVSSQVGQLKRVASEILMVQLDSRYMADAEQLSRKGFFDVAHHDELVIHTGSAGWKAIQEHVARPPSRRPEPISLSFG